MHEDDGATRPQADDAQVVDDSPGFWVRRGDPPRMPRPHRHNDVEVNLVLRGRLEYLIGGRRLVVDAGEIAMFWAAQPHWLIGSRPGDVCWVHLPLPEVLGWGLSEEHLGRVLRMEPVLADADVIGRDAGVLFDSWREELAEDPGGTIALLEAQAMVRRILRGREGRDDGGRGSAREPGDGGGGRERHHHVTAMAQYAVAHFREPITPSDVAQAVHLSPTHGMTIFRRAVGTTLGTYLTWCRVAEAQRLLITTPMPIAAVAHASGFASQSTFYAQFGTACGSSPAAYRRQLR